MIGILCESYKKKTYSEKFLELLNISFNGDTNAIIVFSVSDLDFTDKTVNGNLITQREVKSLKSPIPQIINNLLTPKNKTSRRVIRGLAEQSGIILLNEGNRFNQYMIMEMLLSSAKTRDFVPSYSFCNGKSDINKVLQRSEALVLPETGNNCRAFYTTSDIMKNPGLLSKNKWLVLDIPNTLKQNGSPTVFTLYAVRDAIDKWNVFPLSKSALADGADNAKILYGSASEIAVCIGRFIPSLAFCTIRFVMNEDNSPLLVNFTGWDSSLLLKEQNPDLLDQLASYFLGYSKLLLHSQSEKNYVG